MNAWTEEETRELISLWPTQSAGQIAKRLQRPRSAVCGKANRLRHEGVLPGGGGSKHFDIIPRPPRRRVDISSLKAPKRLPPPPAVDDRLAMRPCSILELEAGRCHWPLGNMLEVATLFCGGNAAPGQRYCAHHLRIGLRQ